MKQEWQDDKYSDFKYEISTTKNYLIPTVATDWINAHIIAEVRSECRSLISDVVCPPGADILECLCNFSSSFRYEK